MEQTNTCSSYVSNTLPDKLHSFTNYHNYTIKFLIITMLLSTSLKQYLNNGFKIVNDCSLHKMSTFLPWMVLLILQWPPCSYCWQEKDNTYQDGKISSSIKFLPCVHNTDVCRWIRKWTAQSRDTPNSQIGVHRRNRILSES